MPSLAAILYPPETDVDALLAGAARAAAAAGARVGGVVQTRDAEGCQGMALVDLDGGGARSIAQNLGPLSISCKLDTSVMADIAADLERQLDAGLDLLVVSRFGKAEIEGGGLRSLFGRAMLAGTPLLTAVRQQNAEAWDAFHGGLGISLPPETAAVAAWVAATLG